MTISAARIRVVFVTGALLLAAGCGDDEPVDTGGPGTTSTSAAPTTTTTEPTTTTDEPTTTTDDGQAWVACANGEEGYTVEHPPGWATNRGVMPPCSVFHPEPFELPEASEIPTGLAVVVRVEPVPFDTVAAVSIGERAEQRQERQVDGRRAARLEVVTTGEALYPEGMQITRWAVELGPERTLVARVTDAGPLPYAEKQAIVDRMIETIELRPS